MRQEIPVRQFTVAPHQQWEFDLMLLTAGDFAAGRYNTMTVGWGSFGTMWAQPMAMVVVRPSRYTYEFMEQYDTFTLSAFPAGYRKALNLLGAVSGRDCDKISQAGLTPEAGIKVPAPVFKEADLTIECHKVYWDDLEPSHFLKPEIHNSYKANDYHRIYFGEIVGVYSAR